MTRLIDWFIGTVLVVLVALLFIKSDLNAKNVANEPNYIAVDEDACKVPKTSKIAVFECCEGVAVSLTAYETETESETVAEEDQVLSEIDRYETEIPNSTEAETTEIPLYSVNGTVLDTDLQEFLFSELSAKGIEYWMPIALAQMYQESTFDSCQITNGIDKGILQYRCIYWEEWCDRAGVEHGDIFNPYKQIEVYCRMVAEWIRAGETEAKTISNHNTGGWNDDFNETYYNDVAQWFDTVQRIN